MQELQLTPDRNLILRLKYLYQALEMVQEVVAEESGFNISKQLQEMRDDFLKLKLSIEELQEFEDIEL